MGNKKAPYLSSHVVLCVLLQILFGVGGEWFTRSLYIDSTDRSGPSESSRRITNAVIRNIEH